MRRRLTWTAGVLAGEGRCSGAVAAGETPAVQEAGA
jgi:hypothetical protein